MFYTFHQNNSFGRFVEDNEVCENVIIEAQDAKTANTIAKSHGIYFNGCAEGIDCDCCGDRWREVREYDGDKAPKICGENAMEYKYRVIIYYLDGSKLDKPRKAGY